MRNINWDNFEKLPGDSRQNFEILWRSLVLDVYGGSGVLREHYNYPGVEFAFELVEDVVGLGKKRDKIGWQCKFPDVHGVGSSPSASTRSQAAESLNKAIGIGLKKCYICVPHDKLLKEDEEWAATQQKKHNIEIVWQKNGDIVRLIDQIPNGKLLYESWFGELIPSDSELSKALDISIQPLLHRYVPELQVGTRIEQELRAITFQPQLWLMIKPADYIDKWDEERIEGEIRDLEKEECDMQAKISSLERNAMSPGAVARGVGYPEEQRRELYEAKLTLSREIHERRALKKWKDTTIVAVMADAGVGKTCLGISLSKEVLNTRPAGAFFMAKDLVDGNIDSLAKTFSIRGKTSRSFYEVLSLLNVAGRVSKCRMPLIIDGLNESVSPKAWKPILSRLMPVLKKDYPYVLLVVTLRSGQVAGKVYDENQDDSEGNRKVYVDACLPIEVPIMEMPRWCATTMVAQYFKHYKIKMPLGRVPLVLRHPLSLSLYCKSINPKRDNTVTISETPLSLNSIFKDYLFAAAENIANHNTAIEKTKESILSQILDVGRKMLEHGKRDLCITEKEQKWIQQLTSEGIGLKRMISADGKEVFEIAYDALAGYMMAEAWLRMDNRQEGLIIRHELSEDIFASLVHLYYERHGRFITDDYKMLSSPQLANIVSSYPETKIDDKIVECVVSNASYSSHIVAIWSRRCLERFQDKSTLFSLELLDRLLLTSATPGIRDAGWSVLIYDDRSLVLDLLWGENAIVDERCLILCKWILTSNVVTYRDRCLHILVDYGRKHPRELFSAVVKSLEINDEYVRSGMAKAGYAVAMSLVADRAVANWREMIIDYAERIVARSLGENADCPVWARETLCSLLRTVELARFISPKGLSKKLASVEFPYKVMGSPFKDESEINKEELQTTEESLHHDFRYYSLPRLVGADNYQTESDKYRKAKRAVQSRMYALGYRDAEFDSVDRFIDDPKYDEIDGHRYYYERFGKKYQKIAYMEYASVFEGVVSHYEREEIAWSIDPCVPPERHEQMPFDIPFVVEDCKGKYKEWLEGGKTPDFSSITKIGFPNSPEEWILVNGFLQQTLFGKQEVFSFFDGLVVDEKHTPGIESQIMSHRHCRVREDYELYYLEYPWSTQAARNPDRLRYQQNSVLPQYIDRYSIKSGRDIDVEVLVREYMHENYCQGSREPYSKVSYIPEPYVALALKLQPSCEDYNWRNHDGEIVFRYLRKEATKNLEGEDVSYSLAYMRKKELLAYLKARKKALILCSNGERTIGYEASKGNINFSKELGYDYRKAEFARYYLSLGVVDYDGVDHGCVCRLPHTKIDYRECVIDRTKALYNRIKHRLSVAFVGGYPAYLLQLISMDKRLYNIINFRKWAVAEITYDLLMDQMEVWRTDSKRGHIVCFCDANGLAHGWRDGQMQRAYCKSDAVVADGQIVLLLARIYGHKLPGRVIGPVLFEKAMAYGVSRGWRHAFCGTNEETLTKLKTNMEAKFPGVKIVGTFAPEYSPDPTVPTDIECDFLWVALGSPKQEKWCARHKSEFKAKVVLPVGAAFDFHAGAQRPIPQWVHKCYVCWLWRMFTGGWRVFKRDAWCVPRAAWILVSEFVRVRVFRQGVDD